MSKESIIAKILGDAEALRAQELAAAQEKIAARAETESAYLAAARETCAHACEQAKSDMIARRRSVAELEVRKNLLAAKQAVLCEVFDAAKAAVLALPEAEYTAFVLRLLDRYAEDGETVVFGKEDPVKRQEIAAFAMRKNMVLAVRKDGDFSGGFVLEGKYSDKNLTLDVLLRQYRAHAEAEIAAILFGAEL